VHLIFQPAEAGGGDTALPVGVSFFVRLAERFLEDRNA
jgi:hypothetical protein